MATHPYTRLFPGKTADPTASDDISEGYEIGDFWINESSGESFQCVDNAAAAAVWNPVGGGSSYDLAAEINSASPDLPIDANDLFPRRQDSSGLIRKNSFDDLINFLSTGLASVFADVIHSHGPGNNQLDHDDLIDKGTNTHAAIDSHIANTSNPHSVTAAQVGAIPDSGWEPVSQTWTYVSAADPVYQIYVSGDVTANADYKLGNKVKCTNNSTTFFGFVVKVGAYDSGNNRTPVDLYGGSDYDLANSAITAPNISKIHSPDGFPMARSKWDRTTTDTADRTQSSPVTNQWYNLGSLSLSLSIGLWELSFKVLQRVARNASTITNMTSTLSTANNSESDIDFSVFQTLSGASGNLVLLTTQNALPKELSITSPTTYYLNARTTGGADSIGHRGDVGTTVIKARFVYL